MPFFGKAANTADGEVLHGDFEWLIGLSSAERAAELMPAFGPDGPHGGKDIRGMQLVTWLMRRYRGGGKVSRPAEKLYAAVQEAMQVLEHAELIQAKHSGDGSPRWNATRMGAAALADGDARKRINDRAGS
jgi:hypothetical protein